MKRLLIVTPGRLPVPALKGGAVETLIEMIILENEIDPSFEIDVFSLWNQQMETIKYNHSKLITVNSSFIIQILDKLYFAYWEKIKKDWRSIFQKNHFRDKLYEKLLYKVIHSNQYDKIIVENNISLLRCVYDAIGEEQFSKVCDYHMHSALIENPMMVKYLCKCNHIITVSKFVRKMLLSSNVDFSRVKIQVLMNTVDVSKFNADSLNELRESARQKYNISNDTFVFLYSGRLSSEKGVEELILAFENLNSDSAKLIIAGGSYSGDSVTSQYEIKIKNYCIKRNLNVDFLGFVKNDNMKTIYALADVLVIPSLVDEAGPLTAIEGMQMKISMIVSNVGALAEYLGNYPIYVEPGENFILNLTRVMQQSIDVGKSVKKYQLKETQGSHWYFEQFKNIIE